MKNLIDLELDLPYKKNKEYIANLLLAGIPENEAVKQDYENNWKEKRKQFSNSTRCISSMYIRLLGKYKNEFCKKIVVECIDGEISERIMIFSDVAVVQVAADIEYFFAAENLTKKLLILNYVQKGLIEISSTYNWDPLPFNSVEQEIIKSGFRNEWLWGKPIRNKEKYIVSVICRHEIERMEIFARIHEPSGVQREILLLSTKPHEIYYLPYLGKLRWEDQTHACLFSKKGDLVASINV